MQINIKAAGRTITMGLDMEILKRVMALGFEQAPVLDKLSSALSAKLGVAIGVSSPSLLEDLIQRAVTARGEEKVHGPGGNQGAGPGAAGSCASRCRIPGQPVLSQQVDL